MMNGKPIFHIPVYAISKNQLRQKYANVAAQIRTELSGKEKSLIQRIIALQTYPQRLWEYNHIVGYIKISVTSQDVVFNIFLPAPQKQRYRWLSSRKTFLYDISANGTHFYVNDKMQNKDIQTRTSQMLNDVIKVHIPKRHYVDKSVFDNINEYIDYRAIMEGIWK